MKIEDYSTLNPDEDPRPDDAVRTVTEGLIQFNSQARPDPDAAPITLAVRTPEGQICAGLLGRTAWGWLRVDKLWVSDTLRGNGVGKQLMTQAEHVAISRGCKGAHLDTFEFQAPGFYKQLGYTLFGQIDDYPDGPHQFFVKKFE